MGAFSSKSAIFNAITGGTRPKVFISKKGFVFDSSDEEEFVIDEEDYLVVCEILWRSGYRGDVIKSKILQFVEIRKNDNERRVHKLHFPHGFIATPRSIGKLEYLTYLRAAIGRGSMSLSLSPSIGQLQHLEHLDLSCSKHLTQLPWEVGDLVSLTKFCLHRTGITSLPTSIGKLSNLKCLWLSRTKRLSHLPCEIGNLASLTELNLYESGISSLPDSIGKLRSLQILNLQSTNIFWLPDSIEKLQNLQILNLQSTKISFLPDSSGKLQNLQILNLQSTKISCLPDSIGKLTNLRVLNLSSAWKLSFLPEDIGNLTSLVELWLDHSNIVYLPSSIGQLKNLKILELGMTPDLSELPEEMTKMTSLIYLNLSVSKITNPWHSEWLLHRIGYTIKCNVARSKQPFGSMEKEYVPRLWPHVLTNAQYLFERPSYRPIDMYMPRTVDILYFLLVGDALESFLGVLVDRNRKPNFRDRSISPSH